jgi:murein DD-endopeptidase MepM/ murein hydrolase activator NlpD
VWPLNPPPSVVSTFDPPDSPYAAGHRGVDLAGSVGQPVLSIGDGVVAFVGVVAGRGVVVVSHGALRSTYEPVSAGVMVGDTVVGGQPIGVLSAVDSHCVPAACLHLGVIRGSAYLDPLPLLPDRPVRLKPLAGRSLEARRWAATPTEEAAVAAASFSWPAVR